MSDGLGIDDVKDELMARYTPVIAWKRVRHTTCKRDPARQVEVREVYKCDPRDTVADAVRYLQRLSERYQQRDVLKTRRVTFAAAAGGPKAIYSTRKMWPPDDCGFTDRYVLEGFTHQQVWEIDDAMMRFMYGDMNGRRPYAEALVRQLVETEDIKADLLAHEEKPMPYFRWVTYTEINGQHHEVANARYELSDPMFGSREEAMEKALDVLRRNKARFVTLFPLEDKDLAQGEFRLPPGRDGKSVDILMRGFTPEEMRRLVDSTATLRESSDDVKDELMAAEVRDPRIRITRSFAFPPEEDDADLDVQSEWVDEEGVSMALDEWDEDDATVVGKAADFLTREGATSPSSVPFYNGTWYSTEWHTVDYRTGEEEEKGYHLVDFTPEEEEAIYDLVTKGKYKRRRAVESLVDRIMEADDPDAAKDELLSYGSEPLNVDVRQFYDPRRGATFTSALATLRTVFGVEVVSEVHCRGGLDQAFNAVAWTLQHKGIIPERAAGSFQSLSELCSENGRPFRWTLKSVKAKRDLRFTT